MSLNFPLVVVILLKVLTPALLVIYPFHGRLRIRPWLLALGMSGLCLLLEGVVQYTWVPAYSNGWWRLGLSVLFMLLYALVYFGVSRASIYQVLFTVFFIKSSYADSVFLFAKISQQYLLGHSPGLDQYMVFMAALACLTLGTLPLMLAFMRRYLCPILNAGQQLPFWRYLWVLPVSFYFIYRLGIYKGYFAPYSPTAEGTFLLPYAWAVGNFVCYFVVLRMLAETIKNARLAEELHVLDVQILLQKEQYMQLQLGIEDARRSRHDIRHQLLAIQGHLKNHDLAAVERYLGTLLNTQEEADDPLCDNVAVDAVARHYLSQAKRAGAEVSASLRLPRELAVQESDICIVLGNLLENAAEALARQQDPHRFLRVKAAITGQESITLSVCNSYQGEVRRQGEAFMSQKRAGEGIGIASVRGVVARYGGVVDISCHGGEFRVYVLLNP